MLCAETRLNSSVFPHDPKSLDGLIHTDHLATPQRITDSSGAVVWAADYKPFGEATVTVSTITNNLRFPGQYFDAETGLNYNYFRDYNPIIGRYIEADPIGLTGGINVYRYVNNNPVNWNDVLGLQGAAITPYGPMPLPYPVFPRATSAQQQQAFDLTRQLLDPRPLYNRLTGRDGGTLVPSEPVMPAPDLSNTPERCRIEFEICSALADQAECGAASRTARRAGCWTRFLICLGGTLL